jgi:hypothetical protein
VRNPILLKISTQKRASAVAPVVERLPSKSEVLSSNPVSLKKRKEGSYREPEGGEAVHFTQNSKQQETPYVAVPTEAKTFMPP